MIATSVLIPMLLATSAASKTLVVASGDCSNTELIGSMLVFDEAVRQRLGADAFRPEHVLERYRPRPSMTLDDVHRLLEAAQTQYYSLQYLKLDENVDRALAELDRLPPGERTWALRALALTLKALSLKNRGKKAESFDTFFRLLRVDPKHALDPDLYSPLTREYFEEVRKAWARLPRGQLTVQSTPPDAEVFLDGRSVGKTPFNGSLPRGKYLLVVQKAGLTSFSRYVHVDPHASVQVDLAFEASLRPQLPLCVDSRGRSSSIEQPLRLAALLGAEELVVLHVESRVAEPGWATAVLLEVNRGARVRKGGLKAVPAGGKSAGLEALADFIVTGRLVSDVVAVGAASELRAPAFEERSGGTGKVAASGKGDRSVQEPPPAAVESGPAPAPPIAAAEPAPASASWSWRRPAGYAGIGVGTAAAAGAAVAWLSGGAERERLSQLIDAQGRLPPKDTPEYFEAKRLRQSNASRTFWTASLGVGAAVFAGVGSYLLLAGDDEPAPAAAWLSPGGLGVFVVGAF